MKVNANLWKNIFHTKFEYLSIKTCSLLFCCQCMCLCCKHLGIIFWRTHNNQATYLSIDTMLGQNFWIFYFIATEVISMEIRVGVSCLNSRLVLKCPNLYSQLDSIGSQFSRILNSKPVECETRNPTSEKPIQ